MRPYPREVKTDSKREAAYDAQEAAERLSLSKDEFNFNVESVIETLNSEKERLMSEWTSNVLDSTADTFVFANPDAAEKVATSDSLDDIVPILDSFEDQLPDEVNVSYDEMKKILIEKYKE